MSARTEPEGTRSGAALVQAPFESEAHHDAQSERALLGAMLADPQAREAAESLQGRELFFVPNRTVLRAIRALRPADVSERTVSHELKRAGALESLPGAGAYLVTLQEAACAWKNVPVLVALVQRLASQREHVSTLRGHLEAAKVARPDESAALAERQADELRELATRGAVRVPVDYLDLAAEAPPVEWLVPGWVMRADIAVLAAPPGAGKSTLAASLAVALAASQPWCGIACGEPRQVLYFDEEQGKDTVRRLFQNCGGRGLTNLRVASCQGLQLKDPQGLRRLRQEIETHRPALVVLDTVAQVFAGVNLHDLGEVSAIFRLLFELRDRYGTAFLLLTHHRKTNGDNRGASPNDAVFGSVGFQGNADTVWNAERVGSSLEVKHRKRRNAPELSMRVGFVQDDAGRITLTGEGAIERAETAQAKAELFLQEMLAARGTASTGELLKACEREGHNGKTAERALKQLVSLGLVKKPDRGVYTASGTPENEPIPF